MEKIILLLMLLTLPVWAESPADSFKAGNAFYTQGKFAEAAQQYQAAVDTGFRSWILEFNLGNAYYRAGQTGQAILHYERAFRSNSSQGDVIYNLELATRKAGDPELPAGALPVLAWRLFYILSINALTLLCSGFFLFFAAVAGSALLGKRTIKGEFVFVSGFVFAILASWWGLRVYLLEKPEGVVVSPVAEVRSGPNTTYPANFTVPEGRRVLLLKEQEPIEGWVEVGVPAQGLKGWVPDTAVKAI